MACLSVAMLRYAKPTERIEVLLNLEALADPRHIVSDGALDPLTVRGVYCPLSLFSCCVLSSCVILKVNDV